MKYYKLVLNARNPKGFWGKMMIRSMNKGHYGVTGWGLYVELPNTVEGLIHISTIPGDYYHYNEAACEMVGEATGRCFKLGMPVRIEVEDCDRFMRTINFRLVDK